MSKETLHSLVDLLDENDTETIYRILIRFVIPEVKPYPDEIEGIKRADIEIANGDVTDFDKIDWGEI